MDNIIDFVHLYVSEEILDEVARDTKRDIVPSIQKYLYTGHGKDKGHLRDSISAIQTPSRVTGKTKAFTIVAQYLPDYGVFINEDGPSNHWKGYHFMEHGLNDTIQKIYGGL